MNPKSTRAYAISLGRCGECRKIDSKPEPGRNSCAACLKKKATDMAYRRLMAVKAGLCHCGCGPCRPGKKSCQTCADYVKAKRKPRTDRSEHGNEIQS